MSKLSKNIVYSLLGQGSVLIISFLAVKIIFHKLGGDAMGIIYFTASINAILVTVLEMGVSSTTAREVAGHFAHDKDYVKKLIQTSSLFYWGIYLLSSLFIFFMAPFFVQKWIHLQTLNPTMVIYILRILGISSIIVLPRIFYYSLLRGLQKMGITNLIDVAGSGMQQLGAILILVLGGGFLHVVYWLAATYVIEVLIYFFACAHFFSFSYFIPGFSLDVVKRNFKFTIGTTLISIFSGIYSQMDKIIISKLLPVATLGYYSFAYGGVSQGTMLTNSVSQAVYPSFSALAKAGDRGSLMSQYHKLQDLVCFGILPMFALVPFILMPLFSYLLNKNVAYLLLFPTTLLCLGFYINGTMTVPYMFSLAVGKPGITAKMNFYSLFIVLPVMAVLIYFFGLTGAGLSWVFYNLFGYFYAIPRMCRECLDIKTRYWYFHIFRILILAILTYGASWFILGILNSHSIVSLASAYISASVVYLFVSYFLITKEFKEAIIYYFKFYSKLIFSFKLFK
ncbi:MAG: oligosaccharide flippase family protein [Candidatus Staskawiczbacteria bacterium]|jgi:O-antigen/teichoic acid export membrane protein